MDIFTWSLPFLVEKVANMMFQIITKLDDGEENDINYLNDKLK